jgi:K+-transporting ATPase ATPase C chain
MMAHLRANLWLLLFTVVICSVLYPLVLLGVGQAVFRDKAEGSLIDAHGEPTTDSAQAVGSRLIGQPFKGDEYFQPRPSAASYNAAASGASNYGASNPALRARVVASLGTILKYQNGDPIGPDVEKWFVETDKQRTKPDDTPLLVEWSQGHADDATAYVKDHAEALALWLKETPDAIKNAPDKAAERFFPSFAKDHRATWPGTEDEKTPEGTTRQAIVPVTQGDDLRSKFFEGWWGSLSVEEKAKVKPVPADLVMTSGSGLDPDITLDAALYQLDRVARKWSELTGRDQAKLRSEIEALLKEKAPALLGGLTGVKLVNVLEVNLTLRARYGKADR